MTDCLATLHALMRSPADMARVQRDLLRAWTAAMSRREKAPRARLQATGEAAARLHHIPVARRVIEKTEKNWSER